MRGPISHLHKKPMKMPEQSEMPQVGGEEEKGGRGFSTKPKRSTYQSVPVSCFISRWRVFLIHVLSFPRSSPLSHSLVPHHPEGLLSSTIASVVNKKRTHQSGPETSGGERSKPGSNLIGKEVDWWIHEAGRRWWRWWRWWSHTRLRTHAELKDVSG